MNGRPHDALTSHPLSLLDKTTPILMIFFLFVCSHSDRNALLLEFGGAPQGVSNHLKWNQSISDIERQILRRMYSVQNQNSKLYILHV